MSKYNEKKMIDDIRLLSLDMIDNAGSGHPGICLSAAPMMYTLFANHMVYDLEKTNWPNRDRFVLSAGHASALLYATLYAVNGDFTIDDLKNFRHINSTTPGHPELNINKLSKPKYPIGRIDCYDLFGNYIKTYNNTREAVGEIGGVTQGITFCCNKKLLSYKGLIWRKEGDTIEENTLRRIKISRGL